MTCNRPSWVRAECADLFPPPPPPPKKRKPKKRPQCPSPEEIPEEEAEERVVRPLFFQNYREESHLESCDEDVAKDYRPLVDCNTVSVSDLIPVIDGRHRPLPPCPEEVCEESPCPEPRKRKSERLCPIKVEPCCLKEFIKPEDIPKGPCPKCD